MINFIVISTIGGFLFGIMDGIINANPLAVKLFSVFKPIQKSKINVTAGIIIDIVYGFAMAGIFILLFNSLPGSTQFLKGISYAILIWFFRVVMYVVTQWMIYKVPLKALFYTLVTGLIEMLVLGIFYSLLLNI